MRTPNVPLRSQRSIMPAIVTSGLLQLRKRPSPPVRIPRLLISIAALAVLAALLLLPDHAHAADPVITGGDTSKSIAENTPTSTTISTYTASDADMGDMLTWSLGGDDSGDFDISTDGKLTFKEVPDYESPADTGTDNVYNVTVIVSDDETPPKTAERAVTITVTNVNEKPVIDTMFGAYDMVDMIAEYDDFAENQAASTIVATFEASDDDTDAELTWGISDDDPDDDSDHFTITKNTDGDGELRFSSSPNFEDPKGSPDVLNGPDDNTYKVTINVSDGKDDDGVAEDPKVNDDTLDVVITVTDANDAPTFPSTETGARNVDENTDANTNIGAAVGATDQDGDSLTYGKTGTDAAAFDIDISTGQLKTKNALDHEIKDSYSFTVTVRDSKNADGDSNTAVDAMISVTITVNDLNEAPTIVSGSGTFNVDENTADSTVIQDYDASDVDLPSQTLTWSIEGTDSGDFRINSTNGMLRFAQNNSPNYEMPADSGTNNVYNLTVKVTDNGSPNLNAMMPVTITVDDVNEAPTITTTDTTEDVPENTTAVLTLAASDVDDNGETNDSANSLTWSRETTDDGAKFSITSSGVLTFSAAPDFETPTDVGDTAMNNTYVVTVKVTDNGIHDNRAASDQLRSSQTLTVTVTNVNEVPTITTTQTTHTAPSKMEIEYDDTSPDLSVVTYTATDPDTQTGNTLTWSVEGDDFADFDINSGTGALSFKGPPIDPPNYEIPVDSDTNNTYEITVKVTDNGIPGNRTDNELDATLDVVVTVTDVNEKPEFTGTPLTIEDWDENVENDGRGVLRVDDYDARDEEGGVTWTLTGTDDDKFEIDSNGVVTIKAVPDYETLADLSETDGRHPLSFNVVATDTMSGSTRRSAEVPVTITIVDLEEAGTMAVDLPNDPPLVDDIITFTLSDPDTIPTPLTDAAIDWAIERRNPGETDDDWVALTGQDVTSLTKEYTVDEDDTGKEIRATVTYTDRRGSGKEAASDDTDGTKDERELAPPRFRSGATQTIPEGPPGRDTEAESSLTDDAMKTLEYITATDLEGEVLIWGILDEKDADLFEILPSDEPTTFTYSDIVYPGYTARLRAIEALDYETLESNDPDCPSKSLCLTLTLSDGKGLNGTEIVYDDTVDASYPVTIEVTDVDEPGEITFSPDEVPEPGVQITATHTDPDGSVTGRSWQWQRSEDPEADPPVWDDISGATSATYTPSSTPDVVSGGANDGKGYYLRATVSYTDGEGIDKSAEAIAGQVGTANTRPQFPSGENGQRSVAETTRAGTNIGDPIAAEDPENNSLTYMLSDISESSNDSEFFTIVSSTGQLRTKEPLNFESGQTQLNFYVDVHDRRDAAGASSTYIDDTQLVIVTVENVDEAGSVELTTVTNSIQATVGILTELSDPDGNLSGITWQWARSSNRSDWTDIATGATYTPSATDDTDSDDEDQGNYLRATASYTDGQGSGKTAELVTARVAAPPPTNAAPVFPDSENGQRELPEDAGTGTLVQGPIQATDFNDDTLTYSLAGSDSGFFTIGTNGQLSLLLEPDESLDYERKSTYRFTVRVSDGANDNDEPDDRIDDTITVTVSLIDVNEPPAITGEAAPEFRENSTSVVATYSARDPEGDAITWSLSGLNSPNFVITDRGQLYFHQPPSFEDGETYTVTVTATDDDETLPRSASLNVTVTVTDVEERGEVTLQPTKGWFADAIEDDPDTTDIDEALPALQTRFTATLEDDDNVDGMPTWQWARSSSEEITDADEDSYTATADDVNRTLRVTATYDDDFDDSDSQGNPVPETATATLRSSIRTTSPGRNTQPAFTVPTAEELPDVHFDTRTVTSGPVAGRSIGSPVRATDADGDVLTYMLRGRDADKFDFDPTTGQIRTKAALDHLEQDSYTLSVSVHDGFDVFYQPSTSIDDTISIVITVLPPPPPPRRIRRPTTDDTPPNRQPEFADGETTNRSVVQGTESGTTIGRPVSASDPDGDKLTYTLGGTDAASFDIDAATGQLKTKAELDAETKSSYSITVSVTDGKNAGGGNLADIDDTITVTITVTSEALSDLAALYDSDEDGLISRDEALVALADFRSGGLTRDEALEVVALYFESQASATQIVSGTG